MVELSMRHPNCYIPLTERDVRRFWSKVNIGPDDACWEWMAGRNNTGYGAFAVRGRNRSAHRVALELRLGRPIRDGFFACHRCNNPACCNQAHLYEGTAKDNALDRVSAGTQMSGDRHWSRLHPENVPRGDNHIWKLRPDLIPRGDRNGSRKHPERLARGDRSGARLHPERLPRGERHGRHTMPECTARGEKAGSAKLTEHIVRDIRATFANGGCTKTCLAKRYGVSVPTIARILERTAWKHVV